MNTNVAAIQDALKTAIDNQTPGCTVSVGYPVGGPDRGKLIWVSGEPRITMEYPVSTLSQRDERLELDVFVVAQGTGSSYAAKRDACLTLVGKVEAALAADRTIGNLVLAAYVTAVKLDEAVTDKERGVGAQVTVVCDASA